MIIQQASASVTVNIDTPLPTFAKSLPHRTIGTVGVACERRTGRDRVGRASVVPLADAGRAAAEQP